MTRTAIEYERPWLAPYQLAAVFCDVRYSIIEASTKSGKTHACIVWLCEQAMQGRAGSNYWWVAPIFAQAKIAYRRLKRALPTDVYTCNETELTITLINGAVIWFKGADKSDSLYGDDVHAVVWDEASRSKDGTWAALRSVVTATHGPIRIIGNVKGRKNEAYRLARKAEAGESGWSFARITAYDAIQAGILSADEIDGAMRDLPDDVFRELYLAEASDDGGNPFGIDAIKACVGELSKEPARVWGWDLAKSVDWSVGIALDGAGHTTTFERFQMDWPRTIDRIQAATLRAPALVDSTGVGDPLMDALAKKFNRTADDTLSDQWTYGNYTGYKFSAQSKQALMEGLAIAIQRKRITYPSGVIATELENFEYVYTRTGVKYSAPAGLHDDCVCALALAVAHLPKHTYQELRLISLG